MVIIVCVGVLLWKSLDLDRQRTWSNLDKRSFMTLSKTSLPYRESLSRWVNLFISLEGSKFPVTEDGERGCR